MRMDTSEALANQDDVGGIATEEVWGTADAVSIPGIFDVDDDLIFVGQGARTVLTKWPIVESFGRRAAEKPGMTLMRIGASPPSSAKS